MNKLLFKLLKSSFISVFFITALVFFTISLISSAIYKYDSFLKNSFAKRQPHIIIKYIDDNKVVNIHQEIKKIKNILKNDLSTINSFCETTQDIKMQKGLGIFSGKVTIIGLGLEQYPITYDFNTIDIRLIEDYNIRLTGIELFYIFNKNFVIFNKTLQKAFLDFAPSVSTKYGLFIDNKLVSKVTFIGVIDDLKEKPIMFMSRKVFNKIFGFEDNHVNGFYINIKNQDTLDKDIKILSKSLKGVEVVSWRNINKKQNSILNIFSIIAKIIQIILIILGVVSILIVFFNGIITKAKQIRILKILGVKLVFKMNILFLFVTILGEIIGIFMTNLISKVYFSNSLIFFILVMPLVSVIVSYIFLSRKIDAKI